MRERSLHQPCTTDADCPSDGACRLSPTLGLRVCVDPGRVDPDAGPTTRDGGVPAYASPCTLITDVCLGADFGCAVRDGHVDCWGSDVTNQHGDLLFSSGPLATPVRGPDDALLDDVVDVECGSAHVCARNTHGDVLCWGDDGTSQLASMGTATPDRASYVHVDPNDPTFAFDPEVHADALVVGRDHCAVRRADRWACWGDDTDGELRIGSAAPGTSFDVLTFADLDGATALAFGSTHECHVLGGVVTCNGAASEALSTPSDLATLSGVTELALGLDHGCALSADGVRCWGSDEVGQLGDGPATPGDPTCVRPPCRTAPLATALGDVVRLVPGPLADTACAITQRGELACWGANDVGQVEPTMGAAPAPVVRTDLGGPVCAAAIGDRTVCAVVADPMLGDRVLCWGSNAGGQLALIPDSAPHPTPLPIALPTP